MDKDTQLPAEMLEIINTEATIATDKEEIRLRGAYADGAYGPLLSRLNGYKQGYISCATEYATKRHQERQENAELMQWKMEAQELLNPILDYGQSKEAGIPLGVSITTVVLERCKQSAALQAKCERYEKALKDIAKQCKVDEMEANDYDGDIAEGYDAIIKVAREALSGDGEKEAHNA